MHLSQVLFHEDFIGGVMKVAFEHFVKDGLVALFAFVFVLLFEEFLLEVVVLVVEGLDPVLIDPQLVGQFFIGLLVVELLLQG
jgi:hypothetical protein